MGNVILKTAWDALPAGSEIILPNGGRAFKCADQWGHHYVDGMTIFNPSDGRLEHISHYFQFDYTGYVE